MREIADLYNVPINGKYKEDIEAFDCGIKIVNDFLKNDAFIMQENSMASTKLFFNEKDELVGYTTLFNDIFRRINKQKLLKEKWDIEVAEFYPAIRLHYMGVSAKHQGSGIGYTMLMEVFETCLHVAEVSGCTFLSVESLESSLDFYIANGFRNMGKKGEFYSVLFKIDELVN